MASKTSEYQIEMGNPVEHYITRLGFQLHLSRFTLFPIEPGVRSAESPSIHRIMHIQTYKNVKQKCN